MPVPVALRTGSIMGQLNEGESVRVSGRWHGGLLRVRRIQNLSTGSYITTPNTYRGLKVASAILATVVLVALILWGVALLRRSAEQIDGVDQMPSPPVGGAPAGATGGAGAPGESPDLPTLAPPSTAPPTTASITAPPPPPSYVEVKVSDVGFDPDVVTIAQGGRLVFLNAGSTFHKPAADGAFMPVAIEVEQQGEVLVNVAPGRYTLYCATHPASWSGSSTSWRREVAVTAFSTRSLDYLQRTGEGLLPAAASVTRARLDNRRLVQIRRIGRERKRQEAPLQERWLPPTASLICGLSGYRVPLAFSVTGGVTGVEIKLGTCRRATTTPRRSSGVASM